MIFETTLENTGSIKLIAQTKDFAIIEKPHGLPSAPLTENELSDPKATALSWLLYHIPQAASVTGIKPIEKGLIHRLDTDTHGLILVALHQKSYEKFMLLQKQNKIIKYYSAFCNYMISAINPLEGFPPSPFPLCAQTRLESAFRPYGKGSVSVRPVIFETIHDESSVSKKTIAQKKAGTKIYCTNILSIAAYTGLSEQEKGREYRIDCSITQGFRHQIRCHLSWAQYPIIGDILYNPLTSEAAQICRMQLHALKIEF